MCGCGKVECLLVARGGKFMPGASGMSQAHVKTYGNLSRKIVTVNILLCRDQRCRCVDWYCQGPEHVGSWYSWFLLEGVYEPLNWYKSQSMKPIGALGRPLFEYFGCLR